MLAHRSAVGADDAALPAQTLQEQLGVELAGNLVHQLADGELLFGHALFSLVKRGFVKSHIARCPQGPIARERPDARACTG